MTVYENLEYFCAMRNMSWTETESYIDEMLAKVMIPDKKHAFVNTLSGGQKRKI